MNISNKQIIGSMAWKSIEKIIVQLTRLVMEIVMARLLIPTDFGTFTLLLTCIALADIVIEGGLGNALIQREKIDEVDINTAFWIMMLFSIVFFFILFFGAKTIANFYGDTSISVYLQAIAFVIFLVAFNSIQVSIATRCMKFKDIFLANSIAMIFSCFAGITLALCGFGVWSLIIQYCMQTVVSCFVLGYKTKWVPKLIFSMEHGKDLYSFGWKIMCANLLNRGYGEIYNLAIGKVFNTTKLGFYNRGKLIPSAIENGLTSVVITVLFPYFSRNQENVEALRLEMQKWIQVITFFVAPVFFGLAAVADPLVRVLLTDKWIDIVPIFQALCIGLMFQPISHINTTVINSIGRSDIVLKLEILKRSIGLAILIVTVQFNIVAVAYGLSVSYIINLFLNVRQNHILINYNFVDMMKGIAPSILSAVFMFGVVQLASKYISTNIYATLIIEVLIGVAVYGAFSYLFNRKMLMYLITLINEVKHRRNSGGDKNDKQ